VQIPTEGKRGLEGFRCEARKAKWPPRGTARLVFSGRKRLGFECSNSKKSRVPSGQLPTVRGRAKWEFFGKETIFSNPRRRFIERKEYWKREAFPEKRRLISRGNSILCSGVSILGGLVKTEHAPLGKSQNKNCFATKKRLLFRHGEELARDVQSGGVGGSQVVGG